MNHTAASFALKGLDWHPALGNKSEREIKRIVERSRGSEERSQRGFGFMRRRNEVPPGQSSVRDGWYFDTVSFAAGAAFATTLMFQIPQSGSKLLNSTNLTGQGGQVPAGETLNLKSIRVYISNTTVPADFQNIINNVSVELKVRNYPVYQVTPEFFPPGFGAVSFSAAQLGTAPAGTATAVSTSSGMPVQTAVYELQYPYLLNTQENFNLVLTPQVAFNMVAASGVNPLGVGTTIRVYLEGTKQAPLNG